MPQLGSVGNEGPTLLLKWARKPLPSSFSRLRHPRPWELEPAGLVQVCDMWWCFAAPRWLLVHLQAIDTSFLFCRDNSHIFIEIQLTYNILVSGVQRTDVIFLS